MGFFRRKKNGFQSINWKIKKKCIEMILASAKSTYPNEFGALLRVDEEKKDTIVELVLLPGTVQGESHAIFKLNMMPVDFSIVGTIHSHPSNNPNPSGADIHLFQKHGKIHIIAAAPYTIDSWSGYDNKGNSVKIEIV